jgi:hypothetical protein
MWPTARDAPGVERDADSVRFPLTGPHTIPLRVPERDAATERHRDDRPNSLAQRGGVARSRMPARDRR